MTDSGVGQSHAAGRADRLHLSPRHRETLETLLREHLPGIEVWAYGSRVNGQSHDGSDLDLVLRAPGLQEVPIGPLADFTEALHDSTLPFLVEARDWARLPERFRKEIERGYVVVIEKEDTNAHWQTTTWGELASLEYGKALRNYRSSKGPYRVFGTNGPIGWHDEMLCAHSSVIIGRKGAYRGVHYSAKPFFVIDTAFYLKPKVEMDVRWAYYQLLNQDINGLDSGSAIPSTRREDFYNLPVEVPPLPEQRAIAHILGTLDDKIELNRRMNETLEAMARALFKSWFIDFDPVRAKMEGRWRPGESLPGLPAHLYDLFPDRLVDSELGEVPEGWEMKTLGTFGEIITGKTPSTKRPEYYGEDIPFLRIPDMHGNMYAIKTEIMLSTQGAESQSKKTLPPGSVSVSCIATPGLVVLNHRDTQTNQQINSIIPYDRSVSRYLYWACYHLSSDIAIGGLGGSVFGNMNKSTFSALPTIQPEPTIVRVFDALVSPIHTAILANEKRIHTLAEQRDALLPKLISGKLRIKDTEVLLSRVL